MGNRLYAMASAAEFAERSGRELIVLWNLRWELNAAFTDFWEAGRFHLHYTDEYNLPWRWINKPLLAEKWLSRGAIKIHDAEMYQIRDEIGGYDYSEYLKKYDNTPALFIETCFNFYPHRALRLPDYFKPKSGILKNLDQWQQENAKEYVGLHIRRTDHGNAIDSSPDGLFEEVITGSHKGTKFFLCTDDAETENRFRALFGDRILSYSRNKSRDSRDGIRDAVMDLLLLSRSSHVYGSFKSTFSSFAADYGNIPLTVLKN